MTSTFACSGLSCHNRVSEAGMWCPSCFWIPFEKAREASPAPNWCVACDCPYPSKCACLKPAPGYIQLNPAPDRHDPTGCYRNEGKALAFVRQAVQEKIKALNPPVPNRRTPEGESLRIRLDVLNASFRLAFGTKAERVTALDTLSHIVAQLKGTE